MVDLPLRNVALASYKLPPNQIHAHCQQPLIQLRAPRPLVGYVLLSKKIATPKCATWKVSECWLIVWCEPRNAWMNPFKKCSVYLDIGLCHLAHLAPRPSSFLPSYLAFHQQDQRTRVLHSTHHFLKQTSPVSASISKIATKMRICSIASRNNICAINNLDVLCHINSWSSNMLLKGIFLHQDKFW